MEILLHDGKSEVMLRGNKGSFELCYPEMKMGKKGYQEKYYSPEKYYASLVQAFDALMKLKISHSDAQSLGELREIVIKTRKELLFAYDLALSAPHTGDFT